MRKVIFTIAVWGKEYVDTFLALALPSFLAAGNIPTCAKIASIDFLIVTRPEDTSLFEGNPVIEELRRHANLEIIPMLTAEQFEGNRYSIMARAHRHVIKRALLQRAILSILSPDCVIADGGLGFGLRRILGGDLAVNVAGPRAVLEDMAPRLTAAPYHDGSSITVPARELVALLTRHAHPMGRLLYWNADPFSAYPSAIYWQAGKDSLLARYFHLHPLFVDLGGASSNAGRSATVDGSLLKLANIPLNRVFTATHSDDICIIELSRINHDPMGAYPEKVEDKIPHMEKWVHLEALPQHIDQFMTYTFMFQAPEDVDWKNTIAVSDRDMTDLFAMLQKVKEEKIAAENGSNDEIARGKANRFFNRIFRRLMIVLSPSPSIQLARLAWPLLLIAKDLVAAFQTLKHSWISRDWTLPDSFAEDMQHDYDVRIVPHRAQHAGPFSWLAHKVLRLLNIVFVVNIAPGMGHNTIELDYFMRLSQSGRLPQKRYVLLRKPNPFHDDTLALYRRHFWFASNRMLLNNLLAPVIARYKDIRLNVGLSRLRWQLRDDGSWTPPPEGQTFLYQVGKAENRAEWIRYYKLRHDTRGITPLKDGLTIEPALLDFLGGNADRLALIHVKYHVVNATARPTDPRTYLPAIRWLQEQGYRVVMIGREQMPAEFAALGVLDYANSPLACYRYDLELVAHAAIVITAGSGVSLMPDCMDVPLVYLNSWHIGMPMISERCVMVPTLVIDRATNRTLTIAEQSDLYWAMIDEGAELFPAHDYEPREAEEDEILEAVKEALALTPGNGLSERQHTYRHITVKEHEALVGARISQYFIDKHAGTLDCSPDVETAPVFMAQL